MPTHYTEGTGVSSFSCGVRDAYPEEHFALDRLVAVSTQNQALNVLVLLYKLVDRHEWLRVIRGTTGTDAGLTEACPGRRRG